jgi:hypothetical protein
MYSHINNAYPVFAHVYAHINNAYSVAKTDRMPEDADHFPQKSH